MSEEKIQDSTLTNEDLDVLRVLLHNIKGISAVSAAPSQYSSAENVQDDL